jgi:hypothetical protein
MLYSDLDTGNFFVIPELPVYVTSVDQLGTSSYLATKDGQILMEGIQHIRFVAFNNSESFQSMNANGDVIKNEGSVSCKNEAIASNLNIQGNKYLIHCYLIDIMGIESVISINLNFISHFMCHISL